MKDDLIILFQSILVTNCIGIPVTVNTPAQKRLKKVSGFTSIVEYLVLRDIFSTGYYQFSSDC